MKGELMVNITKSAEEELQRLLEEADESKKCFRMQIRGIG